jgi:toxin ParE1/3/4
VTRIVWAPQALDDVRAIRTYLSGDSLAYADLIMQQILAAVSRLEPHPRSGRVVPEVAESSLREIIVRNYRIVYRLGADVAEILTVFHEARSFRLS